VAKKSFGIILDILQTDKCILPVATWINSNTDRGEEKIEGIELDLIYLINTGNTEYVRIIPSKLHQKMGKNGGRAENEGSPFNLQL